MTESYFDNIETIISQNLDSAKKNVYIAVAWFTNHRLLDCIARALQRKIEVKLLILDDILNRNEFGLDYGIIVKNGGLVNFSKMDGNIMHNKFCIIDNMVITGSYNWTYHANKNDENILITDEESVVDRYREEFDKLFSAATPIPQPYEHLKWTDVKEGDFSELRRNIFRDVVAKNDHNREVRKAKLIELNNAYKSENQQNIIEASSLPNEEIVTTLFDVLINYPQQFELKLWKEYGTKEPGKNAFNCYVRKWIFEPSSITNDTVHGYFIPYVYRDKGGGLRMSIQNTGFANTLKKFIGIRDLKYDTYKCIPEELICIDNVNLFHFPFGKPMFNRNQPREYLPSGNPRHVYGIDVIGIASNRDWKIIYSTECEDTNKYVYAHLDNLYLGKIEKDCLGFINGWNPFERGKKIQEMFFSL